MPPSTATPKGFRASNSSRCCPFGPRWRKPSSMFPPPIACCCFPPRRPMCVGSRLPPKVSRPVPAPWAKRPPSSPGTPVSPPFPSWSPTPASPVPMRFCSPPDFYAKKLIATSWCAESTSKVPSSPRVFSPSAPSPSPPVDPSMPRATDSISEKPPPPSFFRVPLPVGLSKLPVPSSIGASFPAPCATMPTTSRAPRAPVRALSAPFAPPCRPMSRVWPSSVPTAPLRPTTMRWKARPSRVPPSVRCPLRPTKGFLVTRWAPPACSKRSFPSVPWKPVACRLCKASHSSASPARFRSAPSSVPPNGGSL